MFRRSSSIALVISFFRFSILYGIPADLPEEIHKGILAVNNKVFNDDIEGAEAEAKRIIRKNPDHPAGYFCMAFVIDSWMLRHQSDEKENEFYRYCDIAIEKGEKILARHPDEEWARFFIGGADGFKGTYEARYERWITAFRYGWKGVSVLLELESSGCRIPDIYYGIGSYNYWRSALMKTLWWMPCIDDKRLEGIRQLSKARSEGIYTKTSASIALLDILINEKQYSDALKIADEELQTYPSTVTLLWGKARALYGLRKYKEAVDVLMRIIRKTEKDKYNNHYMDTMCRLYLARIYFAQKKYAQVVSEYDSINRYVFEPSVKRRLDAVFSELKSINRQSLQVLSVKSQMKD